MKRTKITWILLTIMLVFVVSGALCDNQEEGFRDSQRESQASVNVENEIEYRPRVKRYPEHLSPLNFSFLMRMGECPLAIDGSKKYFCPTPMLGGRWVCIDDYQLCDGVKNCPNAEDESSDYCMFYRVLRSQVELLSRSVSALGKSLEQPFRQGKETGGGESGKNNANSIDSSQALEEEVEGDDGYSDASHAPETIVSRFHRQSGRFIPVI